nr:phosphoinositide phosphatase SAC6-like [Ipomoea batatas]
MMMEKADPAQKLYRRMRLWEFSDQYVIEPSDGSSERECVGSYLGHPIFKVTSLNVLPCDHSLKSSSVEQKRMKAEFSALLSVAERTHGLYFSYDVNITLSAQRLHDLGDESKLLPLWRQAEPRFLWNNYMMEVLIDSKVRGTIPILWDLIVDLTYKPNFEIMRWDEGPRVAERHFLDLRKKYGNVVAIDLVNTHGGEGSLSEKFSEATHPLANEDSMIGQKMLEFQLRRLGLFNAEETISKHPNLDENFKILWANHGDDISIQYSGTPALKGDFVRYGKRTINGIVNDGCNALMRYYLNNFCDGTKQSFPMAFGLILIGFFFTLVSLRRGKLLYFKITMDDMISVEFVQYDPWNILFSMIWASISLGMGGFVKANGRVFCNRPRLNQPRH